VSRHEAALSLSGVREPVPIAVQLDIRDLPRGLSLETPLLNFGVVNPLRAEPNAESVRVLNAAVTPWQGIVRLNVPWLSFESACRSFALHVLPLSAAEFKVLVNQEALDLPRDAYFVQDALILENDAQRFTVAVQLVLPEAAPRLQLAPTHIALTSLKPAKIKLTNSGEREWTLTLSSAPWLALSLSEIALEPRETQSVEVRLVPEQIPFAWHEPRGVIISGGGREWAVAVEVTESALKAAERAESAPIASEPPEAEPKPPPNEPSLPLPLIDAADG